MVTRKFGVDVRLFNSIATELYDALGVSFRPARRLHKILLLLLSLVKDIPRLLTPVLYSIGGLLEWLITYSLENYIGTSQPLRLSLFISAFILQVGVEYSMEHFHLYYVSSLFKSIKGY